MVRRVTVFVSLEVSGYFLSSSRLGIFLNWKLQNFNDIAMLKLLIYVYF